MAETVHLTLRIGGNQVEGESKVRGRDGTIECSTYQHEVSVPHEEMTFGGQYGGGATSKRIHSDVTITKLVDKTTPLLFAGLCRGDEVEAEFRFYRPTRAPARRRYLVSEENYYTVELEGGFISAVKQVSQVTTADGLETSLTAEEVSFVFGQITWRHEITGEDFVDGI